MGAENKGLFDVGGFGGTGDESGKAVRGFGSGFERGDARVGFVHIGTPDIDIPDRDRPALDTLVSTWTP